MSVPDPDPHDVTAIMLPGGAPATVAELRADPVVGDGVFIAPEPWHAFDYVTLGDGARVFYELAAGVWISGAYPPSMPNAGEVVADLATLKSMIGALSDVDDELLDDSLAAAGEWVYERTMRCDWTHNDVQLAILLLANRYYGRRRSPEGVAGFGAEGVVIRVLANDPDIRNLLERHLEMLNAGIG